MVFTGHCSNSVRWGGLRGDGEEAACHDSHHGEPAVDDRDCCQSPIPGSLPRKDWGLGGYSGGTVAIEGGPDAGLS